MTQGQETTRCIACNRTQEEVPLITIAFRAKTYNICPQHLPILIHNPQRLTGLLPGAEGLEAADHHD